MFTFDMEWGYETWILIDDSIKKNYVPTCPRRITPTIAIDVGVVVVISLQLKTRIIASFVKINKYFIQMCSSIPKTKQKNKWEEQEYRWNSTNLCKRDNESHGFCTSSIVLRYNSKSAWQSGWLSSIVRPSCNLCCRILSWVSSSTSCTKERATSRLAHCLVIGCATDRRAIPTPWLAMCL
jgi:hypothetical protein